MRSLEHEADTSYVERLPVAAQLSYFLPAIVTAFEGVGRKGANGILRLAKSYGRALLDLGTSSTVDQNAVLDLTPNTEKTVRRHLKLGITTVKYATCPSCNNLHPEPFPAQCGLCETPILNTEGKALKICEYYPFLNWFGRFLSLPGIEQMGDNFCDETAQKLASRSESLEQFNDGNWVGDFPGPTSGTYLLDRGTEGRWYFAGHFDSFNVEGNRIGGKHHSIGIFSASCLNLDSKHRFDPAYMYIGMFVPGKQEPKPTTTEIRHFERPLINDLIIAWTRGVRCRGSSTSEMMDEWRVHRAALAIWNADRKAVVNTMGLADPTSHFYCFKCRLWHRTYLCRSDYESWGQMDDSFLKQCSERWSEADTKERETIFKHCGVRASEMWRLPYFQPSTQVSFYEFSNKPS